MLTLDLKQRSHYLCYLDVCYVDRGKLKLFVV